MRPSRTQLRKGVTCTPSPIRSLIWTDLNPDRTRMLIGNLSKPIRFSLRAMRFHTINGLPGHQARFIRSFGQLWLRVAQDAVLGLEESDEQVPESLS